MPTNLLVYYDLIFAICTGIVSGIITVFIVFICRSLWLRIVEPWYEERIYKDAHIEGQWYCRFIDENFGARNESWQIVREGHDICGTITCLDGPDSGKTYSIKGSFRNLILTLLYTSNNKSELDRGSMSLMLIENGKKLSGMSSLYHDIVHKVVSANIELARTPYLEDVFKQEDEDDHDDEANEDEK